MRPSDLRATLDAVTCDSPDPTAGGLPKWTPPGRTFGRRGETASCSVSVAGARPRFYGGTIVAKLAINGGPKTIDRSIGKDWPSSATSNAKTCWKCSSPVAGGVVAAPPRPQGPQFEEAFARFQDAEYGVAITNGTQAIECALKAIGIRPGDEVIVPAATFVATATACILVNAIPIVVDIDPANYQISPAAVEAAIGERTVGIMPVHYGGYPADMAALREIADRHGLWIIEDCAHAHGSTWNGQGCGSIGDIGCFSLQMGKTLTAGEGGICLTNDEELAKMLYSYHHIGRFEGRPFYEASHRRQQPAHDRVAGGGGVGQALASGGAG